MSRRSIGWIALLVACLAVHATVVRAAWTKVSDIHDGRDYASYHYAAVVAAEDGDPYDVQALSDAARADGTRRNVNPFFYPPPFLWLVAWAPRVPLDAAYRAWFWINEASALAGVGFAWAALRRAGPAIPAILLVAFTLCSAVPDNLHMGQANFPVLAVALAGLWLEERHPIAGGSLVGVACMWKMSPALFVAHWLVRGRHTSAIAACVTAVVLSIATLPLLGAADQLRFYTHVLPGFGSGDYNGLSVPITMFGNHSIPNLYAQRFPGHGTLSPLARVLSAATALILVGGTLARVRTLPREASIAALAVLMLLIPVYTYEHHVVWALPAVAVVGSALWSGTIDRRWAPVYLLAAAAWAFPLGEVKWASEHAAHSAWIAGWALQEAKCAALIALFGLAVAIRSTPSTSPP